MRRRQIFAAQMTVGSIVFGPAIDAASAFDPANYKIAEISVGPPAAGKGDCPKCGKNYPRGLHLHTRACKGADQ